MIGQVRSWLFWSGFGLVLLAVTPASLGGAQAQRAAPAPSGKATSAGDVQAARSPVGLWQASSGRLYRWVAISGGYEERFASGYTLKNGCPVCAGDVARRFLATRGYLYRALDRVSRGVCVRWWCGRCMHRWEEAGTVRIAVGDSRMTVSCANKPAQVCERYTRVRT